ncbi:MAG: hypothetical protein AAGI44_03070 [Pseudomonadota bacterium]
MIVGESVIGPRAPKGDGWEAIAIPSAMPDMGYPIKAWYYEPQHLCVLSAVEVANEPGELELGPEYHLSISKRPPGSPRPLRCTRNEARFVLKAFDLLDAKEDNHVPSGSVRNYWRPVADKYVGHECPCVDEEPAIVEDKGDFVWRGI